VSDNKTFVLAEVKTVKDAEGVETGEFEAIISAPTLDRDGEVIDKGAFEPLPDSIPIHAYHDFGDPVGRGSPYYEDEILKIKGVFSSIPRAQEMRTLVSEGVVASMSVGFMAADRKDVEGVPHVTAAELLEASFVSVPSNREAAVLLAKKYDEKAGARNSGPDYDRLQQIHDLSVANGAECKHAPLAETANPDVLPDLKGEEPETGTSAAEEPAAEVPVTPDDLELRARAINLLAS
jgi:HK97 family phage prohead protease